MLNVKPVVHIVTTGAVKGYIHIWECKSVFTEPHEPLILPSKINPLEPELNPICYLLALLVHHFLHVSRIRVGRTPLDE